MRILLFDPYFNTPWMSGSCRQYELARHMVEQGHDVRVIAADRITEYTEGMHETCMDSITVNWLTGPYPKHTNREDLYPCLNRYLKDAIRTARKTEADIVVATARPFPVAKLGIQFAQKQHLPLVLDADIGPSLPLYIPGTTSPLLKPLNQQRLKQTLKAADAILTPTTDAQEIFNKNGIPQHKLHVIGPFANLKRFRVPENNGRKFRSNHEWLHHRPLVTYVGSLDPLHDPFYLIALAEATAKLDPEIRFLIAGNGSLRPALEHKARERGVLGTNLFLLNRIPQTKLPTVLSASSIAMSTLTNSSRAWLRAPDKVACALATTTPIALNHENGLATILNNHGAGLLLPPNHIEQAATSLIEHLRNADWMCTATSAARQLAEDHFAANQTCKKIQHLIESLT